MSKKVEIEYTTEWTCDRCKKTEVYIGDECEDYPEGWGRVELGVADYKMVSHRMSNIVKSACPECLEWFEALVKKLKEPKPCIPTT